MDLVERVAAAMYEAPDPADPNAPVTTWPPTHPDDLAWWLTRAQAAINAINALNCTAWFHGQPGCICQPFKES